MKAATLFAVLVFTNSGFAVTTAKLFHNPLRAQVAMEGNISGTTPTPIRNAKVQAIITKSWQEKMPDGTYASRGEIVCNVTDEFPVYEVKDKDYQINLDHDFTCKTNLKVGPSTIHAFGAVVLADQLDDDFQPGSKLDAKGLTSGFFVVTDKGDYFKVGSISSIAIENQNHQAVRQFLFSFGLTLDQNGDAKIDENVQVELRVVD
jgi:hypothetical protein